MPESRAAIEVTTPDENARRVLPTLRASRFCLGGAFTGLGWLLDKWLGTQPWCLVAGIVIGSAAGLFEFVRLSSKTY